MPMLECLDNTVGSRENCDGDTFLRYIEDLPGLDPAALDDIVTGAYKDTQDFITKKVNIAKQEITTEIRAALAPNMRNRTVIDLDTAGYYSTTQQLKNLEANKLRGLYFRTDRSEYFRLHINSVTLFWDAAVSTNLLVYDILTGVQLDTIPITTVANQPTQVNVNKTYTSKRQKLIIGVLVDTSLANSYLTTNYSNDGYCGACVDYYYRVGSYLRTRSVEIAQGAVVKDANVKGSPHTNGMTVEYTLDCDSDRFICQLNAQLASIIWYRAGMEIAMSGANALSRTNFQSSNPDYWNELKSDYGNLYNAKFQDLVQNMTLPTNDPVCWMCAPRIKNTSILP